MALIMANLTAEENELVKAYRAGKAYRAAEALKKVEEMASQTIVGITEVCLVPKANFEPMFISEKLKDDIRDMTQAMIDSVKKKAEELTEKLKKESAKDIDAWAADLSKPPLGVIPRYLSIERRIRELDAAIERYLGHNCQIPVEWVSERNELFEWLNKNRP